MSKDLTFRIEERGNPNSKGQKPQLVIDSEGYICGIFFNREQAERAIPTIKRNLENGGSGIVNPPRQNRPKKIIPKSDRNS